jgi:hypothetical protein
MAGLDDRSSAPILCRNQDRPASVARAATPMANALLTGLSLADHVRPAGRGRCSSGVASCSPLLIGAPHDPQKRFPGGFSWWHRGHGMCRSIMVCLSSFPCPNNHLTLHQLLTLSERPNLLMRQVILSVLRGRCGRYPATTSIPTRTPGDIPLTAGHVSTSLTTFSMLPWLSARSYGGGNHLRLCLPLQVQKISLGVTPVRRSLPR